jgi:AcrR family transcriptional regulator
VTQPERKASRIRLRGLRAPRPLLPAETERRLTPRQRQVLDVLEERVLTESLAELTMAQIAALASCSLRTLYGISPSKEELLLTVVDRRLHRIGRRAMAALDSHASPLAALRAYLSVAHEAVQATTATLARQLAGLPGAVRLVDAHEGYVVSVAQALLDRAVAEGEIPPVDTAALAQVLGGLGRELSRPELAEVLSAPPKQSADAIVEIVLRGLRRR